MIGVDVSLITSLVQMASKKIGILTLTPELNYGGILQAYSLQTVLKKITGDEVFIINYRERSTLRWKVKYFCKNLFHVLFKHQFVKLTLESEKKYVSQNVRGFHSKYLKYTKKVYTTRQLRCLINSSFNVVFVGSDQVWRPRFARGIENYFLKGVKPSVSKIAYAASFGVNDWEYTEEQTVICRELIQQFKYVSVREDSAVSLVQQHLNYHNVHFDLDPTMLLGREGFIQFIHQKQSNYIFSYILDPNECAETTISEIASANNLSVFHFNTRAEDRSANLKERVAPAVEDWLSGIYNAKCVITDSFHGCAFSIIFNKPFFVFLNKDRGTDRIYSLLKWLELQDRILFVSDIKEAIPDICNNINWDDVNQKISIKRENVIEVFKNELSA